RGRGGRAHGRDRGPPQGHEPAVLSDSRSCRVRYNPAYTRIALAPGGVAMPVVRFRFALLAGGLCALLTSATSAAEPEQLLVDLVSGPGGLKDKAFSRDEYKHVRKTFTEYVEAKYGDVLKSELGAEAGPLFDFLNANP